ncbi:MAG: HEAT repeat domain-containing protein [Isosphaeraceae bacterium]
MAPKHRDFRSTLLAILAIAWTTTGAAAQQVFERDREIRGPNGNTIDRRVRIERSPGAVTREIDIKRPDGVYHRSVTMPTGPGPGPVPRGAWGPAWGPPPPPHGGGPGFWGGVAGFGIPFAGALAGSVVGNALSTPRPAVIAPGPVVVSPAPVMVAPAPPAVIAAPHQPTPPPPNDPLPAEIERLRSWNGSTRMEAAMLLGKVGDNRAVPALIRAMRDDHKDEVRENSAFALGLIGDPSARPYLEVAANSDSRRKVRDAALKALGMMDQAAAVANPGANPTQANFPYNEAAPQPVPTVTAGPASGPSPEPLSSKPANPPPIPQPILPAQSPR